LADTSPEQHLDNDFCRADVGGDTVNLRGRDGGTVARLCARSLPTGLAISRGAGRATMTTLAALNGSPSSRSRTGALAAAAVALAGAGQVVHLAALDAEGLLARRQADDVAAALETALHAEVLLVATPVYRRTYSGLLKVFFDLMEPHALAGMPVVLGATAGGPADALCGDHALRPLVASLDGFAVPTAVYATHADFDEELSLKPALSETLRRALEEARLIFAGSLPLRPSPGAGGGSAHPRVGQLRGVS
jgi:FMN reductase